MRHTEAELVVLAEIAALVKSQIFKKTFFEQLAPCGIGINAAREHPFYERPCVLNIDFIGSSAVFNTVREVKIHAAACDIRALSQGGVQQYFKRVAVYPVVAVDKKYVLPAAFVYSGIARRREPAVFFADDLDSRVNLLIAAADILRTVGRAVIDKDDLNIFVCLCKNAVNAFAQCRLSVINRYRNTDKLIHSRSSRSYRQSHELTSL